jgi:hypothetical protein
MAVMAARCDVRGGRRSAPAPRCSRRQRRCDVGCQRLRADGLAPRPVHGGDCGPRGTGPCRRPWPVVPAPLEPTTGARLLGRQRSPGPRDRSIGGRTRRATRGLSGEHDAGASGSDGAAAVGGALDAPVLQLTLEPIPSTGRQSPASASTTSVTCRAPGARPAAETAQLIAHDRHGSGGHRRHADRDPGALARRQNGAVPPRGAHRLPSLAETGLTASPGSVGDIGGDMLRRFTLTIDYRGRALYLRRNDRVDEPFEAGMSGIRLRSAPLSSGSIRCIGSTRAPLRGWRGSNLETCCWRWTAGPPWSSACRSSANCSDLSRGASFNSSSGWARAQAAPSVIEKGALQRSISETPRGITNRVEQQPCADHSRRPSFLV